MKLKTRTWQSAALALLLLTASCGSTARVALKPFYLPADLAADTADIRLDLPYRSNAGADPSKHRLDLFLPGGTGWPLLVFVHGGSLEKGDTAKRVGGQDIYRNIGRFYVAHGVGVALVNYRLQPSVDWPGQVDDVATATAWLVERVHEFGGDGRIYLSGHSAGSWLASHVALNDDVLDRHDLDRSDITGVISISGSGFDLTDERTWELFGREEKWKRRFSNGPDDQAWKERASIVPLIGDEAPPFLLLYSEREWSALARQNELMCAALESAHAECKIEQIKGQGHRRMLLAMSRADRPVTQRILQELGVANDEN